MMGAVLYWEPERCDAGVESGGLFFVKFKRSDYDGRIDAHLSVVFENKEQALEVLEDLLEQMKEVNDE